MNSVEFLAVRKLQKEREATDFEVAQFLDQVNAGTSDHEAALEMAMIEVADESYRPEGATAAPVEEVASRPNGECDQPELSDGEVLDKLEWKVLSTLLLFASIPDQLRTFVNDALKVSDPGLLASALDALNSYLRDERAADEIPF